MHVYLVIYNYIYIYYNMETELNQLLHGYGNDAMIAVTVDRWVASGANWDIFYADYPYGQGIPPWHVKHVLENHERLRQERLRQERLQEARMLSEIMESNRTHHANGARREQRLQIDPLLSRDIATKWILKPDDARPPDLPAGGKRKSCRNRKIRKSKKSKKKSRKSKKSKKKSRKSKHR